MTQVKQCQPLAGNVLTYHNMGYGTLANGDSLRFTVDQPGCGDGTPLLIGWGGYSNTPSHNFSPKLDSVISR